ncbi:hypothetical protein [Streptomyces sp. NPDC057740]|uniref:hypothetical protein n=1 Tax=Streptomyces sp. NPDC057740 TaxID=3346234 RepID=UPI0036CEBABC
MAKAPVPMPRTEDFPRWYQDLIAKADLADDGPVRGEEGEVRPAEHAATVRCLVAEGRVGAGRRRRAR